jgi:non-heme chloroperoxidase
MAMTSGLNGELVMPFVEASDRTRLFYAEWGAGRAVVFANGFGMPGDMWNYQRDDLAAAGFRCITYDRRGHGRSDRPASGYDMDTLADDLASLIEGIGVADAVLVGHSMGAAEVVRCLTRHGTARVSGIVLSAPTTPSVLKSDESPGGLDPESLEASWDLLRRDAGTFLAASTSSGPNYWGVDHHVSPLVSEWAMRQIMDTPPSVLIETNRAALYADFTAELPQISVPALVIHGDADGGATALELTGRRTAAMIPQARLVVIHNAGHGLYVSEAGQYNAELIKFFQSLG